MKLTRASSYALHAVAYMAQQKSDRPVASHKIAQERGIPERFLLKVLKPLVSARVLMSIKGPNGGYRLARPASDITRPALVGAVGRPTPRPGPAAGAGEQEEAPPLQAREQRVAVQQAREPLPHHRRAAAQADREGQDVRAGQEVTRRAAGLIPAVLGRRASSPPLARHQG